MNVTLDQARTLEAFAREGTLQAAAKRLHKGHPAVLYALKQLEQQTGLELFDRSGYRTRLTSAGDAVLKHCRELLAVERALQETCTVLQSGWEPVLRVVFDAIVPLTPVLEVVKRVREKKAPTRVILSVDSLSGVEARFVSEQAQVMVSVLPVTQSEGLTVHKLPRLSARLIAHKGHPLAKLTNVTREHLAEHVLLTVRGSDPRLQLATAELDTQSTVHLPDFHSKKSAIVAGIGFGWLPDWLIEKELARKELVPLRMPRGPASGDRRRRAEGDSSERIETVHVFEPRVSIRGRLGLAGEALLGELLNPLK